MGEYDVIMDGGGPWGIRLQGGKDFGVPLNVARVTPGSKADVKGILAGDQILEINSTETDTLTHMDAQNLIKGAGDRLQMRLRKGQGVSLGEIKQVGSGGFAAEPSKTLYTTDVTHSAGVDHKYNAKPKAFISGGGSMGGTTHVSTPVKKFDPKEYARKKKEELERYKEDQSKPIDSNSEVLKALQNTQINDERRSSGSFSKLEKQLASEGQLLPADCAFRMTAEGTDLIDVSPGSRAVMEDIKAHGTSVLSNNSGNATGGSRSFRLLQSLTSVDEDLPPPPPELMAGADGDDDSPQQVQSHTFKMLQQHVDAGSTDQIKTAFDQLPNERGQSIAAPAPMLKTNTRTDPLKDATTVTPMPKAPMPSGPNFRVGRASAPSFKPSNAPHSLSKPPPPPAVNAGEILNPNSRLYQTGAYPTGESVPPHPPPPQPTHLTSYSMAPQAPVAPQPHIPSPSYDARNMSPPAPKPAAQRFPSGVPPNQSGEKKLICSSCQQPLGGPFVSAIGKTWHPEHFCCSSCHVSLQNQAFVEENNNLFCEKCYNQYYAPKCAHCNQAIIGNCVNALGKSWHPDHFICSFCNKNFGSDGFLVDSGKPYCGKCFEDLFSVKCHKCNKPITGGEKYVEAMGKNWHSYCFSCTKCNIRLEGNSFFASRGMPYCGQHKAGI